MLGSCNAEMIAMFTNDSEVYSLDEKIANVDTVEVQL